MAQLQKSIKLLPEEDKYLRALYVEVGIASDRFPQQPEELANFMGSWNGVTGRQDNASEVLHYIFTQRKQAKWPKLGRRRVQNPSAAVSSRFIKKDWKYLDAIYEEFQIPSDKYALDEELGQKLQKEFARRSGRIVPTTLLCAAMIHRRKVGSLTTLRPKVTDEDLGFSDIDEATG